MLSTNQFAPTPVKGELDLKFNVNSVSAQVKSDEATALVPGQAVLMVDDSNGVPKITAATDDADDIFGFINFNIKDADFPAGAPVEVSAFRDNCMIMEASAAIARNAEVAIVVSGQKVRTAVSTDRIIGRAYDKAEGDGDLIRVILDLPGAIKS